MTTHSDPTPIRLALVDDSEVVRIGLRALLSPEPAITLVGEAASVAEAVAMVTSVRPDVLLVDIRLPDGTGFDVCRQIQSLEDDIKVLFLTSVADDKLVDEAIRAGGQGYLLKEINGKALVQAVIDVAAGKSILDPAVTARLMALVRDAHPGKTAGGNELSAQEKRVLELVSQGKTNKEVAAVLGLSEKTVKNYLANVFDKLAVTRRSQAVAKFLSDPSMGR
jgi:two-component system response regulator DevR